MTQLALGLAKVVAKGVHGKSLTDIVDHGRLAPSVPARVRYGGVGDGGIEEEIVDFGIANLAQRVFGKRLCAFEIGKVQGKHVDLVGGLEADFLERLLQAGRVPGAGHHAIGLRRLEELLERFKSLRRVKS